MNYVDDLNSKQKEAVLHTHGPLLILAGAGAGKTKTITYRIAHLIKNGVEPHQILAVTFTNKAANEMVERVNNILEHHKDFSIPVSRQERPVIKTFHSLGVQILRENADLIGFKKTFSIYDREDSRRLIRQIIKDLGYDPKQYEPNKILSIISRQKGDMITVEEYEDMDTRREGYMAQTVAEVWRKYEERLKEEHAFDFDDLLHKALLIIKNHEQARERYLEQFKFIHVDEYQDTNAVQYEMSRILASRYKNICVVGDADQNIYSWRGATIKNILNFEEDYPESKTILLEQNYRSTKNILAAANEIISKNINRKDKKLFTENEDGEKITTYFSLDEYDEARYIIRKSQEIIRAGTSPNEISILFRTNFQSRVLEEVCLESGIPHQVVGTRFFDRQEVKDIVAYIKTALNSSDFASLSRIINEPTRGIGKVTLLKIREGKEGELNQGTREKISEFRKILKGIEEKIKNSNPSEVITHTLKSSGLEKDLIEKGEEGMERIENIREFVSLAKKYDAMSELNFEEKINKMLEDVALATDQDSLNKDNGGVKLMTIHAAKGLEFNTVFVTGLEEGLFPHAFLDEKKDDEEEERRLFYVAVTRARRKLFLTHANFRTIFGTKATQTPSNFLEDIDERIAHRESFMDEYNKKGPGERREYLIDF